MAGQVFAQEKVYKIGDTGPSGGLIFYVDLSNAKLLPVGKTYLEATPAVASLFPNTDHQLCFVHLQRNVRRNLSKDSAKDFNYELSVIKKQRNFETASEMFSTLCEKYKKKDLYLSYLKFPVPIQKHIYTTNTVENFNNMLEVTRVNSGGCFQSKRTADVAVYVVANKLETSKWSKPMIRFIESEYEILQMFNLKFRRENHE